MPKYYCEYCDIFLTHDSITVRRSHNAGKNHKLCVKHYYEAIIRKEYPDIMPSAMGSSCGGAPFYGLKPVGPTSVGLTPVGRPGMIPVPPGGPGAQQPAGMGQFNQGGAPPSGPHRGGYGSQSTGQQQMGSRPPPPGGQQYGQGPPENGRNQGDQHRGNQHGGPPSQYGNPPPQYGTYGGRPTPNGHGSSPSIYGHNNGHGNPNGQQGPPSQGQNHDQGPARGGYGSGYGAQDLRGMGPQGGPSAPSSAPPGMHPDRARMIAQGR